MSTKREPLLSDEGVVRLDDIHGKKMSPFEVRDIYEAARAKDAELIQRLVDALNNEQYVPSIQTTTPDESRRALAATAAGFTPTYL